MNALKAERDQESYKAQQAKSRTDKIQQDQLSKVRRELTQKTQKCEIMELEMEQLQSEVDRLRGELQQVGQPTANKPKV